MSVDIFALLGPDLAAIRFNNPMDVTRISQDGLTKDMLIRLDRLLSLGQKDLTEMAAISLRTLQRYKTIRN